MLKKQKTLDSYKIYSNALPRSPSFPKFPRTIFHFHFHFSCLPICVKRIIVRIRVFYDEKIKVNKEVKEKNRQIIK